jgi:hypothetical protein
MHTRSRRIAILSVLIFCLAVGSSVLLHACGSSDESGSDSSSNLLPSEIGTDAL